MPNGPRVAGRSIGSAQFPQVAIGAHSFGRSHYRHVGASGEVYGEFTDLEFTGAGSGDTLRLRGIANGVNVATGGMVSALRATGRVAPGRTVSGGLTAVRATLEVAGTNPTPGGTLSAVQLNSDIVTGTTLGANTAFLRVSDAGAVKVQNFANFESTASACAVATPGTYSTADGFIKIRVAGADMRIPYFAGVD